MLPPSLCNRAGLFPGGAETSGSGVKQGFWGSSSRSQGCFDSDGEDFRKDTDPVEEQNDQLLYLRECSVLIIQSKFWSGARA